MKHNKIACNATNSMAISDSSELYVWGSGRHGLLGNGFSQNNYP